MVNVQNQRINNPQAEIGKFIIGVERVEMSQEKSNHIDPHNSIDSIKYSKLKKRVLKTNKDYVLNSVSAQKFNSSYPDSFPSRAIYTHIQPSEKRNSAMRVLKSNAQTSMSNSVEMIDSQRGSETRNQEDVGETTQPTLANQVSGEIICVMGKQVEVES